MAVVVTGNTLIIGNTAIIEKLEYVLDKLAEPSTFAYGLRKLRLPYAGDAIRVRRSSDNVEEDIGLTSEGELDEDALNTFIPVGTNGFISVFYDQSGNGVNAIQTTDGRQPRISINGSIIKANGKPSIDFSGSSVSNMVNSISQPVPYSTSFVVDIDNDVSTSVMKGTLSTRQEIQYSSVNTLFAYDGTLRAINDPVGYVYNQLNTYLEEWKLGGSGSLYVNNFGVENFTIGDTSTPTGFVLGNYNGITQNLRGTMSEFIGFNGVLSLSSRNILLDDQINYYGIT